MNSLEDERRGNREEVLPEPKKGKREKPTAIVQSERPAGWLGVIDKMIDKNVGADLLQKVFELQQKAEAEMQRKAFVAAFANFKSQAPAAIERTGSVSFNNQHKYDHVELDKAAEELTPKLSENGLACSWETTQAESGLITVSCRLEHVEGHSRMVTLRGMPDTSGSKNAIQAVGSTIYYLERYTFLAVLGIAQRGADNDVADQADTLIQEEQDEIKALLQSTQTDAARFFKWAGVESVDAIPRKKFAEAKTLLQRKGGGR